MAKVCKLHGDKPQESYNNVLWTDKTDIMHRGRFGENQTKNINSTLHINFQAQWWRGDDFDLFCSHSTRVIKLTMDFSVYQSML